MQHINCIMEHKKELFNDANIIWKKKEEPQPNGNIKRTYHLNDLFDGPQMEMRYCVSCNNLNCLNQFTMDDSKKICNYCCQINSKQGEHKQEEEYNNNPRPNQNNYIPKFPNQYSKFNFNNKRGEF